MKESQVMACLPRSGTQKAALSCLVGMALAVPCLGETFSDSFETGSLNSFWQTYQNSGAVALSSDQVHSGAQAVALSSTANTGQKNIGVFHDYGGQHYGTVSVWVYDSGADLSSGNYVGFYVRNHTVGESLGIFTQDYDLGPSNGGNYYSQFPGGGANSSVDRTQAWRQFTITSLANSLTLSVDGVVIYSAAVGMSFDSVEFEIHGPGFRPAMTYWFDDFDANVLPVTPPPQNGTGIYWTEDTRNSTQLAKIMRSNLDGSGITELYVQSLSSDGFGSLAFDAANGHIYAGGRHHLFRINLDGSGRVNLVPTIGACGVGDVELDLVNGKVYWTDVCNNNSVRRANLDGSNPQTLINVGFNALFEGIALDIPAGKIYFQQNVNVANDEIRVMNFDGSGTATFQDLGSNLANAHDVEIDGPNRILFWNQLGNATVYKSDLTAPGSPVAVATFAAGLNNGFHMNASDQKIYAHNGSQIQRINVDGTGLETLVTGREVINYVEVFHAPSAPNQPPIVSAGADQTVCDDITTVLLSGTATDPDGDTIASYLWTQLAGPAVTLTDATSAQASFTPPLVAPEQGSVTLTFQLAASDGQEQGTATVNVLVKHSNRAPVADSGPNQTVPEGILVSLDGTGSFDPDNDSLASFAWVQTAGPAVLLNGADSAHPTFVAPDVGTSGELLRFQLTVTDAPNDLFCGVALSSSPQEVEITVQYVNQSPILQVVSPVSASEGSPVTLQATATDPDGNALSWSWIQLSGPSVSLNLLNPANPTFIAPSVPCGGAVLTFKVTVNDNYGGSAEAVLEANIFNTNNEPIANAGANQSVPEASNVALNALGSSDPDGEGLSYSWTQISGPAVSLSDEHSATPEFVAPNVTTVAGETLVFELTATDSCSGASTDSVEIKVTNVDHAPIANAGGNQSHCEGAVVTLNGVLSSDPDGDSLTYSWTQTAGPAVTITGANSAVAQFVAPFVNSGATLEFTLTVTDPFGQSGNDTASIAVLNCNTPPNCSQARASSTVLWPPNHKMTTISILGVQDPDNNSTITINSVTQDEPVDGSGDGDTAPDAVILGSTVLLRSERAGGGNGRVYHVHFTVTDTEGSCSKTVTVSVPHSKSSGVAIDGGELYDSTAQ